MKYLNFFTAFFILISSNLFGQTPKQIEADLLKSFKKINYWDERSRDTIIDVGDSLANANNAFGEKLKLYSEKYPFTISYSFNSLKKEYLNICSSDDGLFRIYSWITEGGGTMHEFQNVMQYKTDKNVHSILVRDTAIDHEDRYVYYYSNLYTFKANNKTYYLGVYDGVYCSACRGQGIQVFTIENGKLNNDVKIIKTQTGLHSQLYYEYNLYYVLHRKVGSLIHFDNTSKTIYVPVVVEHEKVTHKYIAYKFTGQYFEKVKS